MDYPQRFEVSPEIKNKEFQKIFWLVCLLNGFINPFSGSHLAKSHTRTTPLSSSAWLAVCPSLGFCPSLHIRELFGAQFSNAIESANFCKSSLSPLALTDLLLQLDWEIVLA